MRFGRLNLGAKLVSTLEKATPSIKAVAFGGERVLLVLGDTGWWELPGDRRRQGENNKTCLVRWFTENAAVTVDVGGSMGVSYFELPSGGHITIIAYGCRLPDDAHVPGERQQIRLFRRDELGGIRLAERYREFIDEWTPAIAAGELPRG